MVPNKRRSDMAKNKTKIGELIKTALEQGFKEIKVFSKYNRKTDVYESCVRINPSMPAGELVGTYMKVEKLNPTEAYNCWPSYEIVCD